MDIKPQNLLVTRSGTVKIADFSVSQVFEVIIDTLTSIMFGVFCSSKFHDVSFNILYKMRYRL